MDLNASMDLADMDLNASMDLADMDPTASMDLADMDPNASMDLADMDLNASMDLADMDPTASMDPAEATGLNAVTAESTGLTASMDPAGLNVVTNVAQVPRLAVLASGSGTLLDAMASSGLPIAVVMVDRHCAVEDVAGRHGIECVVVERTEFGDSFDRDGYTALVLDALQTHDIDLVAMAGWGTILGSAAFAALPGRIVNTHPALLPAFPGWHAVRDALAYGVKVTGCTVHVATEVVDDGPILAQEAVPVLPDDDEGTLHERIKAVERRLYTDTIRSLLDEGSVIHKETP